MLQQSIPASRAAQAARLSAQVQAHLACGGTVQHIDNPPPPPRQRWHPEPRQKVQARKIVAPIETPMKGPETAARKVHGPTILALFDHGESLTDIAKAISKSRSFVTNFLQDQGRDTTANLIAALSRQDAPELIAKLREMAADRYSQRYAGMCIGLTRHQVALLAKKHGITFRGVRRENHQ